MRKLSGVLVFFLLASPARCGGFSSSAVGTTAADFLNLGVGARAMAMGGAYSAAADDATALYWNSAAMTQVSDASLTFMHSAFIASSFFDYASYVKNLGSYGAIGVGLQYFSAGSIAETDPSFNNIGSFSPYDLAASLGYAYQFRNGFLNGFSFGLDGKFIQSKILDQAQTEAVDFGFLSPAYLDRKLTLAFTVQNLGGTLNYGQVPENLPLTLKAGSAYRITERWLASLDLGFPRGDSPYFDAGTEYWLVEDGPWKFAGRAGYSSQTFQSVTGFSGPSIGIGIDDGNFAVDYAFVPYGGLGQAQRISLTYGFGAPPSGESRKPSRAKINQSEPSTPGYLPMDL